MLASARAPRVDDRPSGCGSKLMAGGLCGHPCCPRATAPANHTDFLVVVVFWGGTVPADCWPYESRKLAACQRVQKRRIRTVQQAAGAKQEQACLLERGVANPGVGAVGVGPAEVAETAARHVIGRWHVIGRRGGKMVSGGNRAAP